MPRHWRWHDDAVREPRSAVVFDIDGVLADASWREHFLNNRPKDWDGFFAACPRDPVIESGVLALSAVPDDVTLIVLTGRPLKVQRPTIVWFSEHGLRWDLLIMRPGGQYSASAVFKGQEFDRLAGSGFEVVGVFDDDRSVIDEARARGLSATWVDAR